VFDRFSDVASYRCAAGNGFEAATVAAAASRTSCLDYHMTNFGCAFAKAAIQRTVQDQPASDAGPDEHAENVAGSSRRAGLKLAVHRGIHVVL
jgi:hypothetical protein